MKRISVLAGNPKVEKIDGKIVVTDPQLLAFEEALKFTRSVKDAVFRVFLAFDHLGRFEKQFIDEDQKISSRQAKKPKLSQLHNDIRKVYAEIGAKLETDLGVIEILPEQYMRSRLSHQDPDRVSSNPGKSHTLDPFLEKIPAGYAERQICNVAPDEEDEEDEEDMKKLRKKVNCSGVTASIINKLAEDADEVRTFWINNKPDVISQGTGLAFTFLGVQADVHQIFYYPESRFQRMKFQFNPAKDTKFDVSIEKMEKMI